MTSFKHEEKFRTDLFDSNLVLVLVFVMLIYDNNRSADGKRVLWLVLDTKSYVSSPYTEFPLNACTKVASPFHWRGAE